MECIAGREELDCVACSCDEDTKQSKRHGYLRDKLHTYTAPRAHGDCHIVPSALTTVAMSDISRTHFQSLQLQEALGWENRYQSVWKRPPGAY